MSLKFRATEVLTFIREVGPCGASRRNWRWRVRRGGGLEGGGELFLQLPELLPLTPLCAPSFGESLVFCLLVKVTKSNDSLSHQIPKSIKFQTGQTRSRDAGWCEDGGTSLQLARPPGFEPLPPWPSLQWKGRELILHNLFCASAFDTALPIFPEAPMKSWHSHFTIGETEAQGGLLIFPNCIAGKWRSEPWLQCWCL